MSKIKVGIFFGGPSREREISFAGGRTVYDNLDKDLFEPIPIFVDSRCTLIELDWQYLYKGTIRDFYPPVQYMEAPFRPYIDALQDLQGAAYDACIAEVGQRLSLDTLHNRIDLAFLALHGEYGEDGQLQGLLAALKIPYTGSGILSCALGMDKSEQKKFMSEGGFHTPDMVVIDRRHWHRDRENDWLHRIKEEVCYPVVIRPANQGSSIGVQIIYEEDQQQVRKAINSAFFVEQLDLKAWQGMTEEQQEVWMHQLIDIRGGLGLPVRISDTTFYRPQDLLTYLCNADADADEVFIEAIHGEQKVIAEAFIDGKEFSTIVVRLDNGEALALPPTEIRKGKELYDYRSKYLPGLSRKITPIDLTVDQIKTIQGETERLFDYLSFKTYARIDGFIKADGSIFLNDPNTTSGMMPSSFFFHQAAEVGLSPSTFLTYIINASIRERALETMQVGLHDALAQRLDNLLSHQASALDNKTKVAVILGGYSFERHISVESGRNIYEKLASSADYEPIPVFLKGDASGYELYQIPINLLLKDNADDIRDKIDNYSVHEITQEVRQKGEQTFARFQSAVSVDAPQHLALADLAQTVDAVFIALHGRPGEDGTLQQELEEVGLPYNGSQYGSSSVTINKYQTLQRLKQAGFTVADQLLVHKTNYAADPAAVMATIEAEISYPLIAKPVDDGCSSAVRKINEPAVLETYLSGIFRDTQTLTDELRADLQLGYNEEFPAKSTVLIESLIDKGDASHFLEITGGLMTEYGTDGQLLYQMLEPSEALSGGEVLSLEEKFLAGEGQNITPARYTTAQLPYDYDHIATQVKDTLQRAAKELDVSGYARIDAFVRVYEDGRAETIVIEVNSLPGMTPATCIFHQTALAGLKPIDFIDHILRFGIQRAAQ